MCGLTDRTTGEERYTVVTYLCPTSARQCFPCWDEPAVKTLFTITLVVPADRVALSNMVSSTQGLNFFFILNTCVTVMLQ